MVIKIYDITSTSVILLRFANLSIAFDGKKLLVTSLPIAELEKIFRSYVVNC